MQKKQCGTCKILKELDDFHKSKTGKFGVRSTCKSCALLYKTTWRKTPKNKEAQLEYQLLTKYGLTIDDYNKMYLSQDGCCAICKRHQLKFKKRLAVDHCHKSGKVRGLLCSACNQGIGYLNDDPELTKKATEYLNLHK